MVVQHYKVKPFNFSVCSLLCLSNHLPDLSMVPDVYLNLLHPCLHHWTPHMNSTTQGMAVLSLLGLLTKNHYISTARGSKATPDNHQATSMFHYKQGVPSSLHCWTITPKFQNFWDWVMQFWAYWCWLFLCFGVSVCLVCQFIFNVSSICTFQ